MIVMLSHWIAWARANRVWLASLLAATALNAWLLWLAGLATSAQMASVERSSLETPFEIVRVLRVPPPPDLSGQAEAPPSAMPPRFKQKVSIRQALPNLDLGLPPLRLNLSQNPCDPDDRDAMRSPECAAPQWTGTNSQDQSLDDLALARGWVKPKSVARDRQSAMSEAADASAPELRGSLFKDPPFPPHPSMPQSAGP